MWANSKGRKAPRRQTESVHRILMFVPVDVFVKIANVEVERRALAFVQVGQTSVLNQPPQFPFADAEIFRSLSRAKEAVLERRSKTQGAPHRSCMT